MRVDLRRTDTWENINQVYREALGLSESTLQVQTYMGLHHALWEICTQLTQLVPNKRTIFYLDEAGPLFEPVAVHLSREGFKLKSLSKTELAKPTEWFDAVQKELLFIFDVADDPVTGELYEFPELDQHLADKRVYRITASHVKHKSISLAQPSPYQSQLLSLGKSRAVGILGERVRVLPPVASGLIWPQLNLQNAKNEISVLATDAYTDRQARVEKFEKDLPAGAKSLVPKGAHRLYDRTVFYFDDVDGLSLLEEIAKDCGFQIPEPGGLGDIETTSLCRWQDERVWQGLTARGLKPEQLRGLIAISSEKVDDRLKSRIEAAHARVLKLQNG